MFFVYTTSQKFDHRYSVFKFGFVLGQENQKIFVMSSFEKNSVVKLFSIHTERNASVFKFLRFEERFRKLRYHD